MKRIYLSIGVLLLAMNVLAQQDYFIFIQDMTRQPFYVRMGEVSHSSSATGHIILSPLKDSTYTFFIGFPKGRVPEQLFTVSINRKDHGFELKNMDGKWQLFDLQTLQLINSSNPQLSDDQVIRKTDTYSVLMAGVVDDSAVLYTSVQDTIRQIDSMASVGVAENDTAEGAAVAANARAASGGSEAGRKVSQPQVKAAVAAASFRDKRDIIRLRTENVPEGRQMIYVDRTGAVNDTIRIIIPRL